MPIKQPTVFALSYFSLGVKLKLNPHLFASEDMLGQFDLGEVAFADGFQEPVAADVGLFVCCGEGHDAAPSGLWVGVRLQREREKKLFRPVFFFLCDYSRPQFFTWTVLKVELKRTDGMFAEHCINNILIRAQVILIG